MLYENSQFKVTKEQGTQGRQNLLLKGKVAFIAFQTNNRANGGINSLIEIIRGCKELQPTIITQTEGKLNTFSDEGDYKIKIINTISGDNKIKHFMSKILFNWKVYKLLKKLQCEVVYVNDIHALFCSIFAIKALGLPIIFCIRGVKQEEISYNLRWKLIGAVDKVIVLSSEMKDTLVRRIYTSSRRKKQFRKKTQVVYSIVNKDIFYPVTEEEKIEIKQKHLSDYLNHDVKHIGYFAAFTHIKNQVQLLEEFGPRLKGSNIVLHLFSDFNPQQNRYAWQCENIVHELGLEDRVVFHDFVENIADYYRAIDVTLVASKREGLVRAMIESLSCGTPVVSFDVTSAREILEGYKCGIVVNQGDYSGLFDAIKQLTQASDLYESYRKNGLKVAQELFSKEGSIRQVKELLYSLGQRK